MENTLKVFVLNMRGQVLMPCSPPKARKLLRAGKAVPVRRTPFVIQLTVPTGETKQPITLGVDAGYKKLSLLEKRKMFLTELRKEGRDSSRV